MEEKIGVFKCPHIVRVLKGKPPEIHGGPADVYKVANGQYRSECDQGHKFRFGESLKIKLETV